MKSWMISIGAAVLVAAAPLAAQSVFFGSLHSHTSYSDGSGTPEDAYKAARKAGLDFFAITEHNHAEAEGSGARRDALHIATDSTLYRGKASALIETADRLDDPGDFVTLYGQEFSTTNPGNHVNVFGAQRVIPVPNGRYDLLAAFANANPDPSGRPLLIQMNHPRSQNQGPSDYGQFQSSESPHDFPNDRAWLAAMDPLVELIELLSGPALDPVALHKPVSPDQSQYFRYLNLGFHVAPTSGHDNHYRNWGTSTDTRTGVIASRLTRAEIMNALRSRHAYATQDPNLRIVFRANGALQGDIIRAPAAGSSLTLTVSIRDDDEPAASYDVEVMTDRPGGSAVATRVARAAIVGNTAASVPLPTIAFTGRGQYVLLRVTQTNAGGGTHKAWTAPVWFE